MARIIDGKKISLQIKDELKERVQALKEKGREVTLAFLGNLLYELDSIQNYRFITPSADLTGSPTVLPCLGTVAVSAWEA